MTTEGNGDGHDDPDWIVELARQRRGRANSTPRGSAVSAALVLPAGALPHDQDLRTLLRAINAVHGDGELPLLPVRWGMLPDGADARYLALRDMTRAISLTINPNRARWRLAAAHGIGHFLDHMGIPPTSTMASSANPLLDDWRRSVMASRAYVELTRRDVDPYLLRVEEVWARSYAQWLALRSQDESLHRQAVESRGTVPTRWRFFRQWDDSDFGPIGEQIDRLFRRLGWIA